MRAVAIHARTDHKHTHTHTDTHTILDTIDSTSCRWRFDQIRTVRRALYSSWDIDISSHSCRTYAIVTRRLYFLSLKPVVVKRRHGCAIDADRFVHGQSKR